MSDIKDEIFKCIITGNDNKALSYLYQTTLRKVQRYILKNNGTKDDASDIFQDAIIIFFNQVKQNKFNQTLDIDGFIFTVARNLWIDKMRKGKRMVNYQYTSELDVTSDFDDQLKDLISKEKTSALHKAFNKLDEKCRTMLQYVIYERKSMKQVAELMNYRSEDVAKTTHYRCKEYLTKIVKGDLELVKLLRN